MHELLNIWPLQTIVRKTKPLRWNWSGRVFCYRRAKNLIKNGALLSILAGSLERNKQLTLRPVKLRSGVYALCFAKACEGIPEKNVRFSKNLVEEE